MFDTMIYAKPPRGAVGNNKTYWQTFEYMFVLSKGKPKTINLIVTERMWLYKEYVEALRVPDFLFVNVTDKKEQQRLKKFIERHEWLGNLSQYTTHWFACYHKDNIAGAILFNIPNAFSKNSWRKYKGIGKVDK